MINFQGKRALVTGSNGLVGRVVISALTRNKIKYIGISKSLPYNENCYSVDITRMHELQEFIKRQKKFDYIIHCAAIANPRTRDKRTKISKYNSIILRNLFESLSQNQPHWIFMSSIMVYGEDINNEPKKIELSPKPIDDYGEGKLFDEKYLLENCPSFDIFRLPPLYNSEFMDNIKKRVFFPLTEMKIKIFPSPKYTFCHTSNLGKEIIKTLEMPTPAKRIHHICDEQPIAQSSLISKFNGPAIKIPKVLLKIILFLIPKLKIFRKIRLNIKKIASNNLYAREKIDLING